MAQRKKRKYTREAWEALMKQVQAQKSQEEEPEEKSEAKVEVHIHNVVPAPVFNGPRNSADAELERLSGNRKLL